VIARVAIAALLVATVASAPADTRRPAPCTGCVLEAARASRALVVVLHGDDSGAAEIAADWRAAAAAAHVALFAPQCPRDLGCDGSWWKWALSDHHDAAWLDRQIEAVRASLGIERVYVAGFSGGATYLSAWAPARARDYPAVALVSGGALLSDAGSAAGSAAGSDGCPVAAQSALLMIGSEDDMLDHYVRPWAQRFGRCANTTTAWRILDKLGHHEMHRALADKRAGEVIEWLLEAEPPPDIIDAPIAWSDARAKLTLAYRRAHSDPDASDLTITPRAIVLHYTDGNSASSTISYFDQLEIEPERAALRRAGAVNVSSHFVVDRDGTIYQLQPPTRFARHAIGMNHLAIGIENVGDGHQWPLTDAQVAADAKLIRVLAKQYPITHLLGHSEIEHFRDNPYYVERDPNYRNSKPDPGDDFMASVRAAVRDLHLAGIGD
jgi:pimeloyl-ACP methyl ester carboxylesterase